MARPEKQPVLAGAPLQRLPRSQPCLDPAPRASGQVDGMGKPRASRRGGEVTPRAGHASSPGGAFPPRGAHPIAPTSSCFLLCTPSQGGLPLASLQNLDPSFKTGLSSLTFSVNRRATPTEHRCPLPVARWHDPPAPRAQGLPSACRAALQASPLGAAAAGSRCAGKGVPSWACGLEVVQGLSFF